MSKVAIQVGGATVTGCDAHWLNQNWPSRPICAWSPVGAVVAGAVAVTLRSTDCPGARSAGSDTRWSVSQALNPLLTWAGQPPAVGAKCRPRWTGLSPPAGQGWNPALVTRSVKGCVWLTAQFRGTP